MGGVSASPHNHQWLITEAILASLATPPYFEPLEIVSNLSVFRYREPLGHNNPASTALHEASRTFSRKHLGSFISLGAGLPRLLDFKDPSPVSSMQSWIGYLVGILNPLGAFITLGAGLPKPLDLKDAFPVSSMQQWMGHLVKVSNDTEIVHENLSQEL